MRAVMVRRCRGGASGARESEQSRLRGSIARLIPASETRTTFTGLPREFNSRARPYRPLAIADPNQYVKIARL
jgi:hypothetical protein